MQDFGEALIDIRDRFQAPLPVRVQQTRVFFVTFVEALGGLLSRGEHAPWGLPDFHTELDAVIYAFRKLEEQPCTLAQAEQAKDAFAEIIARQQRRIELEHRLWINAVQAGMFLAHLMMALLSTSMLMSLLTHREAEVLPLALAIVLVQVIAGVMCRYGWHYWR